jgi:hypothetical protein
VITGGWCEPVQTRIAETVPEFATAALTPGGGSVDGDTVANCGWEYPSGDRAAITMTTVVGDLVQILKRGPEQCDLDGFPGERVDDWVAYHPLDTPSLSSSSCIVVFTKDGWTVTLKAEDANRVANLPLTIALANGAADLLDTISS